MIPTGRFAQVEVASHAELRAWLLQHHEQPEGVWLVTWKQSSGDRWFPRQDVVDELLRFGWIDGVAGKLDDERTKQLVTPRRVQHRARRYKRRVEVPEAEGLMHPAVLRAVQASQEAGLSAAIAEAARASFAAGLAAALWVGAGVLVVAAAVRGVLALGRSTGAPTDDATTVGLRA